MAQKETYSIAVLKEYVALGILLSKSRIRKMQSFEVSSLEINLSVGRNIKGTVS